MLVIRKSLFVDAEDGSSVLMTPGDFVSEIEDAGSIDEAYQRKNESRYPREYTEYRAIGWNVTCRFTPSHKQWTEIVTCGAVELLQALEGRDG